ncbi:MAG: DUF3465 domain-containing protein [Gammaproteobacteria bacterium]|jgi:hypothetical protein|nr:DUF3465 domain-containing protein [Gammaproteobacteria bacterium]
MNKQWLRTLLVVALALAANYLLPALQAPADMAGTGGADQLLAAAFAEQRSDVLVNNGAGRVKRVLADDNQGSRHQRFILELGSGQTVLIAHNIDLAPRIPGLRPGDLVEFAGEYEWNDNGGVVHWTHHDPAGRHPGGWLRHQGQVYE